VVRKARTSPSDAIACPDFQAWEQRVAQLAEEVRAGDESARARLRAALEEQRKRVERMDWEGHLRRLVVSRFDAGVAEGLLMRAKALERELLSTSPSLIERLLVERVVTCWLHVHTMETRSAGKHAEGLTIEMAVYWQKAVDRAQRRYLSAARSLAYVGRLLRLPPVQVNIAVVGESALRVESATPQPMEGDEKKGLGPGQPRPGGEEGDGK